MLFKMSASKMNFEEKKKKLQRVLLAGTVGIPTSMLAIHFNFFNTGRLGGWTGVGSTWY